ncbi:MAG: ABC transporter ATP-binding protein [Planctomycetota bacterium]
MGDALLSLENIRKFYLMGNRRLEVLKGISMTIQKGEYIAVMGPSGSGKSTLLNILGLLDIPDEGNYFLQGQNVARLNDDKLSKHRNLQIGFIFQSFNLFPQLTVLENIEVPMSYARYPKSKRRKRAKELAEMLGLGDRMHHRSTELSGGQMQRTAIARALANDPPLLLADEPTGNLDEKTGEEVLKIFETLTQSGRSLLMVTHNMAYRSRVHRTLEMKDGVFI